MTDKKIVIGSLSGWQFPARRDRVRRTILPEARRYGFEQIFLMGGGAEIEKPILEHDMLILPVSNRYQSLPMRTRAFCRWALENRTFDYLFKNDDDGFISVPRFHKFVQGLVADYVGVEFHPSAFWHSGGAGYFLSKKAAEIIAEQMTQEDGAEDFLAGLTLNQNGIPTTYMRKTMDQNFAGGPRVPAKDNDLIVAHAAHTETWLTDSLWQTCYEQAR